MRVTPAIAHDVAEHPLRRYSKPQWSTITRGAQVHEPSPLEARNNANSDSEDGRQNLKVKSSQKSMNSATGLMTAMSASGPFEAS